MMEKEQITPEEKAARKQRLSFRLFILTIVVDVLLVIYLLFELIIVFGNKNSGNSSVETAINIINLLM